MSEILRILDGHDRLKAANKRLREDNDKLRKENARLLGELCRVQDVAYNRQVRLALAGALPEQQAK